MEPMDHRDLEVLIDGAWERRRNLTLDEVEGSTRPTVERVIAGLEYPSPRLAVRHESGRADDQRGLDAFAERRPRALRHARRGLAQCQHGHA